MMSLLGGGAPSGLVQSSSSALPAVIAIAMSGVDVVLLVAFLVIAAHVVVERQYPGCCSIKPQIVGNQPPCHSLDEDWEECWDKEEEQRLRWWQ